MKLGALIGLAAGGALTAAVAFMAVDSGPTAHAAGIDNSAPVVEVAPESGWGTGNGDVGGAKAFYSPRDPCRYFTYCRSMVQKLDVKLPSETGANFLAVAPMQKLGTQGGDAPGHASSSGTHCHRYGNAYYVYDGNGRLLGFAGYMSSGYPFAPFPCSVLPTWVGYAGF